MRADFSLPPKERAVYGATITARSMTTGETITLVRTNVTALEAARQIVGTLDAMDDDFRVVCISTPTSIERDLFANRIQLDGDSAYSRAQHAREDRAARSAAPVTRSDEQEERPCSLAREAQGAVA